MSEQCLQCGEELSAKDFEFVFEDPSAVLKCPKCQSVLPQKMVEALREEFEKHTVVCPNCGVRSWLVTVEFDLWQRGYCCPACGGAYSEDCQKRIGDINNTQHGRKTMEEFKYYRLQCRLADAEPKDFHSLENAYELLVDFFDEKVKTWFADDPQDISSELPSLAWIRKKLKEFGKVDLELQTRNDERFCLCLSECMVHFMDSEEDPLVKSESLTPTIGKPCSYIPSWSELFSSAVWREQADQAVPHLPLMLGRSEDAGKEIVVNLTQLPHLLIAGATGSGKSVLVRQLINSLVEANSPERLRLVLFDPKYLEFSLYQKLPHLLAPIINEPEKMLRATKWLLEEMNQRYRLLAATPAKNLQAYNALENTPKLPYIVVVLDEFADLMCYHRQEFERTMMSLAAKSRAAGIHLIMGTQRPDRKVITGSILANFLGRISMKETDKLCSKLLLDCAGAETLQGKGDMLFRGIDGSLQRIQAGYEPHDEFTERLSRLEGPQVFDESLLDALKSTGEEGV
ncbi:MAG: DUF87 domain-containing protein [Victivallales bacterium]|nr:DUF87 domain-containing protein [Victivallales bacterium]